MSSRKEKSQCGEAGRGDVPHCDDPPPGPTTGRQHGEAGCGDVPLCDDPPPGPLAERSMARQGVETFRIATILLPVPGLNPAWRGRVWRRSAQRRSSSRSHGCRSCRVKSKRSRFGKSNSESLTSGLVRQKLERRERTVESPGRHLAPVCRRRAEDVNPRRRFSVKSAGAATL